MFSCVIYMCKYAYTLQYVNIQGGREISAIPLTVVGDG